MEYETTDPSKKSDGRTLQEFTTSLFAYLKNTSTKSVGLGISSKAEIVKKEDTSFSLGSGVMLDHEVILDKQTSTLWRSTSYLTFLKSFDVKKKNLILLTLYYQPLLFNYKDYRINLEANVRTILINSLRLFVENSVNFMYDTRPPEDILTNDLVIKSSLVYEW